MMYGAAIRPEFQLEAGVTFLNNGSYGATPRVVARAQDVWRARMEAQPVRFIKHEMPAALRAAAAELAAFVGAEGDDLVFVENVTAAANAVVRSIAFEAGDEILTTSHAYPAIRNVLGYVAGRAGARLVEAPVPYPVADDDAVVAAVAGAITSRTRFAILDHITSPTAVVFPIARLAALCREKGVPLLVDGAHGPGMVALDVPAIGCDWYTGNAHKWLFAGKGCGFLWSDRARQDAIHPAVISNNFGTGYLNEFDWIGTRDPSAWLAVTDAIAFHRRLGSAALMARNHALAVDAATMLAARWGTVTGAPPSMLGATATIRVPEAVTARFDDAQHLHDRLVDGHAIELPTYATDGHYWLRISAQVYNEAEEYDRLAEAVAGLG